MSLETYYLSMLQHLDLCSFRFLAVEMEVNLTSFVIAGIRHMLRKLCRSRVEIK